MVASKARSAYTSRLMTACPPLTRSSHLSRAAVVLYAVAQLFIALVSVTEGRFGADARAHVEAAGTSMHHAHDEGGCAACAARALLSTNDRADRIALPARPKESVAEAQTASRPNMAARASARPRAPPVRQA